MKIADWSTLGRPSHKEQDVIKRIRTVQPLKVKKTQAPGFETQDSLLASFVFKMV
jgi:hypothetical protein